MHYVAREAKKVINKVDIEENNNNVACYACPPPAKKGIVAENQHVLASREIGDRG